MENAAAWRKRFLITYFAYICVFDMALLVFGEPMADHSRVFALVGDVFASFMIFAGLSLHKGDKRRPWDWFLAASVLYLFGEAAWAFYVDYLNLNPSTPSPCDIFYLSNSFVSIYAGNCYLEQSGIRIKKPSLDVRIALIAVYALVSYYIIYPLFVVQDMVSISVNMIVLLLDFLVVFVLFSVVFDDTTKRVTTTKRAFLLAIAFSFFVVADPIVIFMDIHEMDLPSWLEPFWAIPFVFFGAAAMVSDEENDISEPSPRLIYCLDCVRILLPYLFTVIVLIFLGTRFDVHHPLLVLSVVLVCLLARGYFLAVRRNGEPASARNEHEQVIFPGDSEAVNINRKIIHAAEADFFTHLIKMYGVEDSFTTIAKASGVGTALGAILVDIDDFDKNSLAQNGVSVVDIHNGVVACIRSIIRNKDVAGCFSGDKYIILLPEANHQDLALVAARLIKSIGNSKILARNNITLSLGCASRKITSEDYSPDRLIKDVNDALLRAKESGGNQFVIV